MMHSFYKHDFGTLTFTGAVTIIYNNIFTLRGPFAFCRADPRSEYTFMERGTEK